MRILFLNTFADHVGGAETYLFGLKEGLECRGHSVAFFGTSPDRDVDEAELRVIRRPEYDPHRLFRDEPVCRALELFLARFDPDVIHVHNLHHLGLDLIGIMAASAKPVIQTVHDFSVFCPNAWCVHGSGKLCSGGAGAQCFAHACEHNHPFDALNVLHTHLRLQLSRDLVDSAISPGIYLCDMLTSHGFRGVRHLFHFVDLAKLKVIEQKREDRNLLYMGRLDPEKGLDVLLHAIARVLEQEPGTTLTIVGDGVLTGELKKTTRRLGVTAAVRFHGKVPHKDVKHFYATATAMVVPSIWSENSPMTIYESLGSGLPVIGSRIGGIPDLVVDGETGFLCPPRKPDALAEVITRMLRTPADERKRMSERAMELGRTFSPKRHIDGVEAIYRELLERGTPERQASALCWDDDLVEILFRLVEERDQNLNRLLRSFLRRLLRSTRGLFRR